MLNIQHNHIEHSVFWLPAICVLLHIFEEFAWPGGFLAWHRGYQPRFATSITPRFAVVGNALLLMATLVLGLMGPTWSRGLSLWLTLVALLAGNATFHIAGALRMRRYSPGIVTGVLLYLPLCVWGFMYFLANNEATFQFALVSFVVGASYQFWSMLIHRRLTASTSRSI
ncbi:MAG TPA: HXXEE domain-containing protein [Gammaproteobacteria bacterium]|nr:HXXEE domain-containing protein [Gammaproteobacteria bacterium]